MFQFETYWSEVNEPILQSQNHESYRFSIDGTNGYFKLYRLENNKNTFKLHIKEFRRAPYTLSGKDSLIQSTLKPVPNRTWQKIIGVINENCFWTMPVTIDRIGLDGATWILEGFDENKNNCTGKKYHLVSRWSPDSTRFRSICEQFMELETDISSNYGKAKEIFKNEFKVVLDSANVKGAILIYDSQANIYYSNDFAWARKGKLPASTFKIPNSIIALETGVVTNDSTLFKWNGEKRHMRSWEQDLIFKDAFHLSCVPCYQDVATQIGVERMNAYLDKFNYGEIDVDTTNIRNFWLQGNARITSFRQINFLSRFYASELPISERTENIMKNMMVIEQRKDYCLSGKTGWSIRSGNNNGWFVGRLKTADKEYFFATNIEPGEGFDMGVFSSIRKTVTHQALKVVM